MGRILVKLPVRDRLTSKKVCRRWRDISRDPSTFCTIDLRGVPGCIITGGEVVYARILRFAALALPSIEGAVAPVSRLRRLLLETSVPAPSSLLGDIGRHPSMASVKRLVVDPKSGEEALHADSDAGFLSLEQVGGLWQKPRQSFPSLDRLHVKRLLILINEPFPGRTDSGDPFLTACDRVCQILGSRPALQVPSCVSTGVVRLRFPAAEGEMFEDFFPVDGIGALGDLRPLLAGLRNVLQAAVEYILPRRPHTAIKFADPPSVEIESAFMVWDSPSIWEAVTHLAQGTATLSILENPDGQQLTFSRPSVAPNFAPDAKCVPGFGRPYRIAGLAYRHYLLRIFQVVEEAPSLRVLTVKSRESNAGMIEGAQPDPRWAVAAAEGLATLLLSLRSNATLQTLSLSGFYGRRLAFPAPYGGSWIQPGVDSFARAYLALVKANRTLKNIELGHLAGWCRPTSDGRPSLPSEAATIFSESSVTHLALRYVTLGPADDAFFTSAVAHSRNLVRLSISGCDFDDRQAQALAAALSGGAGGSSCPLKEVLIQDTMPYMTDAGLLHFADSLPKCGLTKLTIKMNDVDGEGFEDHEFDDHSPTTKGLAAILRGLELNVTLRHLDVSPVQHCIRLTEFDIDPDDYFDSEAQVG